MTAAALFCAATVAAGWVVLWPVRSRLGAPGHHLAAVPLGFLVWSMVATVHAAASLPWSTASFGLVTVAACAAGAFGTARLAAGEPGGPRVPAWTYPAVAAVAAGIGAATAWAGRSFVTADSWANYEPMGMRLYETGAFFARLFEERSLLLPAMQAAHRAMGGDWLVAAFPLAATWAAATIAWALYREARRVLGPPAAAAVAAGTVGLMATSAAFVLQALYVHTHMLSAACLALAFAAIVRAAEDGSVSWYAVAGGASAAFALARPDGLAYALLPLVAALALAGGASRPRRAAAAFLAPFWVPLLAVYGVAVATIGRWPAPTKLSADKATATLAALAVAAAAVHFGPALLGRFGRPAGRRLLLLVLAASWCGTAAIAYVRSERFAEAGRAMLGNLVDQGHYGPLWGAFVAAVVLTAAFPALRRALPATGVLLFAILEFMAVAYVIHGLTHVGHLGWTDSFSRIAFHAAPLVWWLLGALAASGIATLRTEGP